jgi:hypothetical protein
VVNGASFDLWAGTNAGAGYYAYTFAPRGRNARLPDEGSLEVDQMDFFRLLASREHFSMDMYLNVVEAGSEVVRGRGWVTCGWLSCDAD